MYTISAKLSFYIPHSASLKDKRRIRRSLIDKTRQRFNISIAEVDTQDIHQRLSIGIAVVSGEAAQARKIIDEVVRYMQEHADAELTNAEYETTERIHNEHTL